MFARIATVLLGVKVVKCSKYVAVVCVLPVCRACIEITKRCFWYSSSNSSWKG
ncbi:hypothetical protein D3C81_2021510 [compost metagenome]